jgi:hypothetical protein
VDQPRNLAKSVTVEWGGEEWVERSEKREEDPKAAANRFHSFLTPLHALLLLNDHFSKKKQAWLAAITIPLWSKIQGAAVAVAVAVGLGEGWGCREKGRFVRSGCRDKYDHHGTERRGGQTHARRFSEFRHIFLPCDFHARIGLE